MNSRKKSIVWNFFIRTSINTACCSICKQNFSYKSSTSSLKKHIVRKHPSVLLNIDENDSEQEDFKPPSEEHTENIFIEYELDTNQEIEKVLDQVNKEAKWKAPSPFKNRFKSSPKTDVTRNELNYKFSNLAESRNKLLQIEIEAAKKDLELKEFQITCAKREDDRKQKEHEIMLKIKEAQLQVILKQNKSMTIE